MAYKKGTFTITVPLTIESYNKFLMVCEKKKDVTKTKLSKILMEETIESYYEKLVVDSNEQGKKKKDGKNHL